tara:strand:+ start:1514 stop:1819 length:306 start_codon:yes stop_codon:yes gene_type:complete
MVGRLNKRNHPARFRNEVLNNELRKRNWTAKHFRKILREHGINPKIEEMSRGIRQPSGGASAVIAKVLGLDLTQLWEVSLAKTPKQVEEIVGKPLRGRTDV